MYRPLNELNEQDEQINYLDKTASKILRCERCSCFANLYFEMDYQKKLYKCNICLYQGNIPEDYLLENKDTLGSSKELSDAVVDILVGDQYKTNEFRGNNVLLAFDMSFQSLENGSFFHVL